VCADEELFSRFFIPKFGESKIVKRAGVFLDCLLFRFSLFLKAGLYFCLPVWGVDGLQQDP